MSSSGRRGKGKQFFTAELRFFRIILDDTIREGRLRLSKTFVKRCGSNLPNSVLLRIPGGAVWPMELSRYNDNVWLQNGWQEFANHYSLDYGHMIAFEHERDGNFNILIFDKSATEIKYPRNGTESIGETEDEDECEAKDDGAKDSSEYPSFRVEMKPSYMRGSEYTKGFPRQVCYQECNCKIGALICGENLACECRQI